jgi:hypothetical protein
MTSTRSVVFGLLSDLGMVKIKEWIENLPTIRRLNDRRRTFCLCYVLALQSQGRSVQRTSFGQRRHWSLAFSVTKSSIGPCHHISFVWLDVLAWCSPWRFKLFPGIRFANKARRSWILHGDVLALFPSCVSNDDKTAKSTSHVTIEVAVVRTKVFDPFLVAVTADSIQLCENVLYSWYISTAIVCRMKCSIHSGNLPIACRQ